MKDNNFLGTGNAAANGNGYNGKAVITDNSAFGGLNLAGNGNALGGGDGTAVVKNNKVNGFGSASFNGNTLGTGNADADVKDNTVLGDFSATGNGNAIGSGADGVDAGDADISNNNIIGSGSGTFNGNGGATGHADVKDNTIIGDGSVSNNGNQFTGNCGPDGQDGEAIAVQDQVALQGCGGNGSAELVHNKVIGDGSLSNNVVPTDGTFNAANNTIIGDNNANQVGDNFNTNTIIGNGSGNSAGQNVQNNTVIGDGSGNGYADNATGNLVVGDQAGNGVNGANNIAMGNGAGNGITASNTVAIGTNALAAGNSGVAIGDTAYAAGPNDTALGAGATVTADHSTALGAGAKATLPNQFVMGTKSDTYKAPGITSGLSKSRQSGPLEVVTSDANGNLATDGGQIFNKLDNLSRRTNENSAGVALALAAVNPDLTGNESFGMTANWGNFDGSNAFGMGFEGVVGHGWITRGDRVAVTGGFGVGFVDGNGDNVFGGRVGGQWTWGGAPQ